MPRSRKNRNGGGVVPVEFKGWYDGAMAGGVLLLPLTINNIANFSNGIAETSMGFQFFRLKALRVELVPRPATAASIACAFSPDAVMGNPGSNSDVLALLDSAFMPGTATQTVPTSFRVPPVRLKGQLEWYKCVADAASVELEAPGTLMWFGTSTESIRTIVHGVIEFKNPTDQTVSLRNFKQRVRDEVIEELKSSIAPSSPSSAGVPTSWTKDVAALTSLIRK